MSKAMSKLCEELKWELKAELNEIKESIGIERKEARKDFREVRNSMGSINKVFEEMKNKIDDLKGENVQLGVQNEKLKSLCEQLSHRVNDCENRLMNAEQYSRNANVEIKGIPSQKGEDLSNALVNVGNVVGEAIQEDDVKVCHRVPVPNSDAKNIVVQFVSRKEKKLVSRKV